MFIRGFIMLFLSATLLASCFSNPDPNDKEKIGSKISIRIDTEADRKPISPYIYGINDFLLEKNVTAFSIRQGGNRYSAYNWENNLSNAGSDWHHYNDNYLSSSSNPAAPALNMFEAASKKNIPYTLTTLQMAGYVSADGNRAVQENETAPSTRFKEVRFAKNAPFNDPPNLNDNYVYMDEYVNYLVSRLGSGVMNYNLDNEPSLWPHTHPRVHPEKTKAADIVVKSAALAAAVKAVDPRAEIFAPALYGLGAYSDFHAPDWNEVKRINNYDWFISYFLEAMAKKENEYGLRLLDVLDVHYYSEARGGCRVVECNNNSHTSCIEARVQAARSLWQPGYYENSWIGQYLKNTLPVINRLNQSIEKYYPDTKLSFTEYSLGGGSHISGAVAQADILGVFGRTGVYLAALWPDASNCDYQLSAINLYTNYDGKGSSFGNTHILAECSDIENAYCYASIQNENTSMVNIIAANKSLTKHHDFEIILESPLVYSKVTPYAVSSGSNEITQEAPVFFKGNTFIYKLPPMSVVHFVVE